MIVVVDTNVLVSGLLIAYGGPARVLDLITRGDLRMARDDRIAAEYRQVLARPRCGLQPEAVAHLLDYLSAEGLPLVSRPYPLYSLTSAISPSGGWPEAAAPVITGSLMHFRAEACRGVEVLTPAAFIEPWGSGHR
jgi:hypothetical protein